MTQIILGRTPEVIATEINTLKNKAMSTMLQYSIDIGQRLEEAKAVVGHGQWGKWLEDNVDYSQSQANKLMQVYREFGDKVLNSETFAKLDYSKAVALLAVPEEMRETFVETHDVEEMSTRELKEVINTDKDIYSELNRVTKELEAAEADVVKLKKEIEEVKSAGVHVDWDSGNIEDFDSERVAKLEQELSRKNKKIEKMENATKILVDPKEHEKIKEQLEAVNRENEELKNKPVEVVSSEAAQEIERLKVQVSEGQEFQMLKAQFKTTMTMVNDLKESLGKVRGTDSFDRYKKAITDNFEQVVESLKNF